MLPGMRTSYTVWEWSPFTGWTLFLGSNVYSMAAQVKRGMQVAEPQKFYDVYGSYDLFGHYEIVGYWQGRRYSWGYSPTAIAAAEIVYGLNKTVRGDVIIDARDITTGRSSSEVFNEIPYWRKQEIVAIKVAAGVTAA